MGKSYWDISQMVNYKKTMEIYHKWELIGVIGLWTKIDIDFSFVTYVYYNTQRQVILSAIQDCINKEDPDIVDKVLIDSMNDNLQLLMNSVFDLKWVTNSLKGTLEADWYSYLIKENNLTKLKGNDPVSVEDLFS